MERKAEKSLSMDHLTSLEIMDKLWLSRKDILRITTLSKNTLARMIEENRFPLPYRHKKTLVWDNEGINKWILNLTNKGVDEEMKTAITWNMISKMFDDPKYVYLTNRDIAETLDASLHDVCLLTRLMELAGEINKFEGASGKAKMYSRAEQIDIRLTTTSAKGV